MTSTHDMYHRVSGDVRFLFWRAHIGGFARFLQRCAVDVGDFAIDVTDLLIVVVGLLNTGKHPHDVNIQVSLCRSRF